MQYLETKFVQQVEAVIFLFIVGEEVRYNVTLSLHISDARSRGGAAPTSIAVSMITSAILMTILEYRRG